MKHGLINIGAATPEVVVGAPFKNSKNIVSLVKRAEEAGIKILVFPELCLTAYTCSDLFFSDALIEDAKKALLNIASETADADALFFVGLPIRARGKLFNCSAAVKGGKILGIVPKTSIPNYGEFYEARHFAPAPDKNSEIEIEGSIIPFGASLLFECVDYPDLCVACEICEDLWVSGSPASKHTAAGATVVVNPSASNELIGKDKYRRTLIEAASGKMVCAYAYSDAGEGESTTDVVFSGHCMIADNGVIKSENPPFGGKQLISATIDVAHIARDRLRTTTYKPYDNENYQKIKFSLRKVETPIVGKVDPRPFIPSDETRKNEVCRSILEIQSRGLAKRLKAARASRAVIGISGGLDSCLALLATVQAMDLTKRSRKDVVAVTMPCFGTTSRTKNNAEILCEELGVEFKEVNITEAVNLHFRDIGHNPEDKSVVYENSQARERTQVLMDIANGCGGIVVGTGDLSELALGWATFNGDHMSNYGVNAGIPKTLVRHVVSYAAERAENDGKVKLAEALKDILDTPVSPELLPAKDGEISQCTEDIVGPYDLHDFFLYRFVRWGETPEKIFRMASAAFDGEYSDDTIKKWLAVFMRRFYTQQFKRSALPDGPKVGSVALSPRGDWRMPSDAEPPDTQF